MTFSLPALVELGLGGLMGGLVALGEAVALGGLADPRMTAGVRDMADTPGTGVGALAVLV